MGGAVNARGAAPPKKNQEGEFPRGIAERDKAVLRILRKKQ